MRKRVNRIGAGLALTAIATVVVVALISRGNGGESPAPVAGRQGLLWGAAIGPQLTGGQAPFDMGAVSVFAAIAGKRPSLVHFFSPFAGCESGRCHFYPFPAAELGRIRRYGAIPILSWSSQAIPSRRREPAFTLAGVASGRYDVYIRHFARAAARWGHPFFLRFDWEMNGNWFPWAAGVNGNSAADYVAAWRHVHDIFEAAGATDVTWVWCPNVDPNHRLTTLESLYPGDAYVDWTGLDGYDFGRNPGAPHRRVAFAPLFGPTYREITTRIAPGKPMLIAEVGASERGGQKPAWIAEMLRAIPGRFPQISGISYFDTYDDGMDWPLETSAATESAFARGISSHVYLANRFAHLGPGKVMPQR